MAMNIQKLIVRAAGLANTHLLKTHWPLFGTVTYRDGEQWESKHISNLMDNYRVFIKRNGHPNEKLVYIWTAENHKDRDYIHYHYLVWIPNGVLPPRPDTTDKTRKPWWPYGRSNVQKARSPAGYMAKYLAKSDEKLKLKSKARRYSINVRSIVTLDYLKIPSWLAYYCKYGDKIRRVAGWGWVNFTTNRCYDSPYRFTKEGGLLHIGFNDNNDGWTGRCHKALDEFDRWLISVGQKPYRLSYYINPITQYASVEKVPHYSQVSV